MDYNILLTLVEMFNVGIIILLFYRLKHHFGFAPLYLLVGTLYIFANILASFLYIDFLTLFISPGSIVIFASILYTLLLVYLNDGKEKATHFGYGLILVNAVTILLLYISAVQIENASQLLIKVPSTIFFSNIKVTIFGLVAFVFDVIFIQKIYEFLFVKGMGRTASIYLALWFTLVTDSIIFVTGAFGDSPFFTDIFKAHIVGKTLVSLFYGTLLSLYQKYFGWESN